MNKTRMNPNNWPKMCYLAPAMTLVALTSTPSVHADDSDSVRSLRDPGPSSGKVLNGGPATGPALNEGTVQSLRVATCRSCGQTVRMGICDCRDQKRSSPLQERADRISMETGKAAAALDLFAHLIGFWGLSIGHIMQPGPVWNGYFEWIDSLDGSWAQAGGAFIAPFILIPGRVIDAGVGMVTLPGFWYDLYKHQDQTAEQ